jgi:hyperosmotically inducible periplasmic protein
MTRNVLLACALPLLIACGTDGSNRAERAGTNPTASPTPTTNYGQPPSAETQQPDNTGVNERDRNSATLTPGDQAENETDRTITQDLRKAIVGDDALSMVAENVKIMTVNGVVTLRGPVRDEQEKTLIASKARAITGVTRVDNQLEVITR